MNKIIAIFFLILVSVFSSFAQKQKKIKVDELVYCSYTPNAKDSDTSYTVVLAAEKKLQIFDLTEKNENPIPGLADFVTYVNFENGKVYSQMIYSDEEKYFCETDIENKNIEFSEKATEKVLGYNCKKLVTSINSNTVEVWITKDLDFLATPMPNLGKFDGTMVKYCINGNSVTELKSIKKKIINHILIPDNFGIEKTRKDLSSIRREKLIITTKVFDKVQIHWGDTSKTIGEIPSDSVFHFAGGTLILKKIEMPVLPSHYQVFAELREKSLGDAYDRTGSLFVIPRERELSFYDALTKGLDSVPCFIANNGKSYQGICITPDYLPLIELVRFFTPFGVNYFNDRLQIDGLDWADEVFYKQEITDLSKVVGGEVLIGAYIGNYDGGGHELSLEIKSYPQEEYWNSEENKNWTLPLFNTCNVMEMAGQNYGSFFESDSLTVNFEIPENVENLKLRYITTGHGGWDGGDEFNQKSNTIIVDGETKFVFTPWRSDCGTYREYNPVSGNFWNGVSSSDYSRSGWCPGTATQPVYYDLSFLKAGKHSITIAIQQGEDEGSSFNAWNISGVLVGSYK